MWKEAQHLPVADLYVSGVTGRAGKPEEVAGLADIASGGVQHPEEQRHLTGKAELLVRVRRDGQHGFPDARNKEQNLQQHVREYCVKHAHKAASSMIQGESAMNM